MKPFKYTEVPDIDFQMVEKIETEDRAELLAFLVEVPAETPVAWFSHKDEQGHTGVWLRRGNYRLKHGSFVDPSDLSCYAAQYYEPFASGRHECLQIGRSPQAAQKPEDAMAVSTAQELMDAIDRLAPLPKSEPPVEDAAEEEASELKLLQPDSAFELHGALTRGWHAQRYIAANEDGETTHHLIVL